MINEDKLETLQEEGRIADATSKLIHPDSKLWNIIQREINNPHLIFRDAKVDQPWENAPKNIYDPMRISQISWIDNFDLKKEILSDICEYNSMVGSWNYDLDGMENIQYGIYPVGGHYDWHVDEFSTPLKYEYVEAEYNKTLQRKISFTIFLNDPHEYEGGELDIEMEGPRQKPRYKEYKLPKATFLIFRSCLWHRVRPVTSGVRKSLVGWIMGPPFR